MQLVAPLQRLGIELVAPSVGLDLVKLPDEFDEARLLIVRARVGAWATPAVPRGSTSCSGLAAQVHNRCCSAMAPYGP